MAAFSASDYDSSAYEKFRPTYRQAFYDRLYEYHRGHGGEFKVALDVATGTGKVAAKLAEDFETVYATDVSTVMMAAGPQRPNLHYIVAAAEDLSLIPSNSVDVVTVAEALHWLDHEKFLGEARRVLNSNGTFAVIGYHDLVFMDSEEATIRRNRIYDKMSAYIDPRRQMVRNLYVDVEIPLKNVQRTYYGRNGSIETLLPLVMEEKIPLKFVRLGQLTSSMVVECTKDKGEAYAKGVVEEVFQDVLNAEPGWTEDTEVHVTWESVTIFAEVP